MSEGCRLVNNVEYETHDRQNAHRKRSGKRGQHDFNHVKMKRTT